MKTKIARLVEQRFYPTQFEWRAAPDGGIVIEGHAAVFGKRSQDLGGFVERVAPTAFNGVIGNQQDVRALFNHDANMILGRTAAGTLDLSTDSAGLAYRVKSAADPRSYESDLQKSIERGDVNQSSFGFRCITDSWATTESDYPERTLHAVDVRDLGPCTFPAYLNADAGVAALQGLAGKSGRSIDQLVAACEVRSLGPWIRSQRNLLYPAGADAYAPDMRAPEHDFQDDGTGHCSVCSWDEEDHNALYGPNRDAGAAVQASDPAIAGATVQPPQYDTSAGVQADDPRVLAVGVSGQNTAPTVDDEQRAMRAALQQRRWSPLDAVELRDKYTADELKDMAAKGQAMKNDNGDPSYPIKDAEDLDHAVKAVGRGGADHDAIRRHVMDRAKALGLSSSIPDNWNQDGSLQS